MVSVVEWFGLWSRRVPMTMKGVMSDPNAGDLMRYTGIGDQGFYRLP